eukprot:2078627-Ditylum_brightwellii.AAC.1
MSSDVGVLRMLALSVCSMLVCCEGLGRFCAKCRYARPIYGRSNSTEVVSVLCPIGQCRGWVTWKRKD